MYFKYVFQLLVFQLLHNTANTSILKINVKKTVSLKHSVRAIRS